VLAHVAGSVRAALQSGSVSRPRRPRVTVELSPFDLSAWSITIACGERAMKVRASVKAICKKCKRHPARV